MGADESSSSSSSPSLDHSGIDDMMMMMVAEEEEEESLEWSRKRKLPAEETDLLPLSKQQKCLEQQQATLPDSSCLSSYIESTECSSVMEVKKTRDETSSSSSASVCMSKDSCYSTGSSSWSSGYAVSDLDQSCSKGNAKIQEYVEDLEFICPEFAVEELIGSEDSNLEGSYTLSSARWSVSNQDSEEAAKKPTIDQEFEEYFSTLMM